MRDELTTATVDFYVLTMNIETYSFEENYPCFTSNEITKIE